MKRLLALLLAFVLAFMSLISPAIAAGSELYFPTVSQGELNPDWSKVTFSSFPKLDGESTAILDDQRILSALGYNPSRSWVPGASLMDVIKVGDLYNFGLGEKAIGSFLGGADPNQVSLGSFSALNAVSMNELLTAVPGLKNIPVSSFPLAQSLFSGQWSAVPTQGVNLAANYFPQINQFMQDNPALANIPVGQIIQGDWNGALSQGAQIGLTELTKAYPQLANIPIADVVGGITSGNFQGVLNTGLQYGVDALVKEFPQLQGVPVGDILGGLTSGNWRGALNAGVQYGSKYLVSELAKQFPQLANVPLGAMLNLNNFSLASVPNLTKTAISSIPGIANQSIGSIPGLGNVSVADVLSLTDLLKMEFAKVDFLDQAAGKADYTLTGSTKDDHFVAEPCVGKCPHFEVQDSKSVLGVSVKGRQWVTSEQEVSGGKGILAKMNDGKEPTGMVPWGFKPNIKLVATEVNDAKGKIELGLYLRVCVKKLFVDFGCTPYFIGPIPFGSVSEKGTVLIATNAPPPQVSVPPGFQNEINGILGIDDCSGGGSGDPSAPSEKYGHKAHQEANASDLVSVPTPPGLGRGEVLHKDAAAAFSKMRQDAAQDGIDLSVISGYRSKATQQQLWDAQVAKQGSEEAASKISAPPGYSEHHTGYSLDISGGDINLTSSFDKTPTYQWLSRNAGKYGFELSFPKNSSSGAGYEPWQWRFTGSSAAKTAFSSSPQPNPTAIGNQNLAKYLNRISIGESSGGTNIGPHPQTGAYGEYQFIASTRNIVLQRTGLDAWSTNKATRDKAAIAWIQMYGQEKGVDLIGAIRNGDFELVDKVLSRSQFTSLPGGPEQSPFWRTASNRQQYGPAGKGGGSCVVAAVPCPPDKPCLFYNPLPGSALSSPYGMRRGRMHSGIDLATTYAQTGPAGKIHAAADGVVYGTPDYFGRPGDYGHRTEIYHPEAKLYTSYSHQHSRSVRRGQQIKRGQVIGVEGSTSGGMYTHLHYEIARAGGVPSTGSNPMNPMSIPHSPPLG